MEYLKLDSQVLKLQHKDSYIQESKGKVRRRRIFEKVQYTEYELEQIQSMENKLIKENKHKNLRLSSIDMLKCIYANEFKLNKAIEQYLESQEWKESVYNKLSLKEENKILLDEGVFYQYGRDYQFRPVIIIDMTKINLKKFQENELLETMCYLLKIVQTYMFIPGLIENWIIFIEVGGKGISGMPIGFISTVVSILSKNFNGCLEKMYVLNPSTSLKFMWGTISSFLEDETKEKIQFIKSNKDFEKLSNQIPKEQLEQKFKGNAINLENKQFYPPKNTIPYTQDHLKQKNQQLIGEKQDEAQISWNIFQKEEPIKQQQQKYTIEVINDTQQIQNNEILEYDNKIYLQNKQQQYHFRSNFKQNDSNNSNTEQIPEIITKQQKCSFTSSFITNADANTTSNQEVRCDSNIEFTDDDFGYIDNAQLTRYINAQTQQNTVQVKKQPVYLNENQDIFEQNDDQQQINAQLKCNDDLNNEISKLILTEQDNSNYIQGGDSSQCGKCQQCSIF